MTAAVRKAKVDIEEVNILILSLLGTIHVIAASEDKSVVNQERRGRQREGRLGEDGD